MLNGSAVIGMAVAAIFSVASGFPPGSTVVAMPLFVPPITTPPPPDGSGVDVGCLVGRCGFDVYAGGTTAGSGGNDVGGGTASGGAIGGPDLGECHAEPLVDQPVAGSVFWDGHTAAEGQVVRDVCTGGQAPIRVAPYFLATGASAPVVDPAVLAERAFSELEIPTPDARFGPTPSMLAVNYWTYLYVTDPGPLTASASAGGVTVSATATLTSVTWSMGEPKSLDSPAIPSAPFTCEGSGEKPGPTANTSIRLQPDPGLCAYAFRFRSLPERTDGTGQWPVNALVAWTVNWSSNTGVTGTATLSKSSVSRVSVGEWRTVAVVGQDSGR